MDPYRTSKFEVVIDGFDRGMFVTVSGLKHSIESIEYREGGENETPHKVPGQSTFDDVTFTRGTKLDGDFITWIDQIFNMDDADGFHGEDDGWRKTITLYLRSKSGQRVKKWVLLNAWPKEVSYSDLDASANEIMIETLIIAHEGMSSYVIQPA